MSESIISLRGVKKSFSTLIFKDVNLDVKKGDAIVIIGGSGCGKSTLLRCFNRHVIPEEGEIIFNGVNILDPKVNIDEIRMKIGMVYQSFNLFSHLNVIENVILAPMKLKGVSQEDAIKEAEELLKLVGMDNRKYFMPHELSGGQKQRVAIARTLAMHPDVILFDEPTSALDPTMVDEVENVIKKLIKSGMTSIIVTHEMRFAKNVATKVVFLAEQGIYESGSAAEIFDHPSKDLTRKFLYRARMFEKEIDSQTDMYSLRSEMKAFAVNFGLSKRQDKAISYCFDELLLPVMNTSQDKAVIRLICSDVDGKHQLFVAFPGMKDDPFTNPAVDEIGLKIWNLYTSKYSSCKNGDGDWEVSIYLD